MRIEQLKVLPQADAPEALDTYVVLLEVSVADETTAVEVMGRLLTAVGKLAGVGPVMPAEPPRATPAPVLLAATPEPTPAPPPTPDLVPAVPARGATKSRRKSTATAPTPQASPDPAEAPESPADPEPPTVPRVPDTPTATGQLNGTPIPKQVANAITLVPVVSWLRAQGYETLDDIHAVCMSTFRDEVGLLLMTQDEFMRAELSRTMVSLGMLTNAELITASTSPANTTGAPALDAALVARVEKAATLREVLVALIEAGIDGDEALVDACTTLTPQVPLLQRITNLRDRVVRSSTLIGRNTDGPIVNHEAH